MRLPPPPESTMPPPFWYAQNCGPTLQSVIEPSNGFSLSTTYLRVLFPGRPSEAPVGETARKSKQYTSRTDPYKTKRTLVHRGGEVLCSLIAVGKILPFSLN